MRIVGVSSISAAVLGASGFSGGELVRLLDTHPSIEVTYVGANRSVGKRLAEVHPHLAPMAAGGLPLKALDPDAVSGAADVVFTAMPHGSSARLAPALLGSGSIVIDLAGDFRLPAEAYPRWYGFEHPEPAWLDEAIYGLPELFGDRLPGAKLVANPGCFPTPVILGCAPLLEAGLIQPGTIFVDGKTGLSGAGRGPSEATSFAATDGSIRPYRIPGHQHTPEMERGLELAAGTAPAIVFAPHLVPTVRGVLTTCFAPLRSDTTTEDLLRCLADVYRDRPFVRVLAPGEMADAKRTRGTNLVELQAVADPRSGTAVVIGALDNLVKGAAGQAIQNANLVLGLPEETGLSRSAVVP
jgi:N-acetyl-gamma-glutamyl-phosphate reductase